MQVLIVGDMNIAASQKDVYDKLDRDAMYPEDEKELFASILVDFQDVWRNLHPDTKDAFTVWDEKTSARAFNEVRHLAKLVVSSARMLATRIFVILVYIAASQMTTKASCIA